MLGLFQVVSLFYRQDPTLDGQKNSGWGSSSNAQHARAANLELTSARARRVVTVPKRFIPSLAGHCLASNADASELALATPVASQAPAWYTVSSSSVWSR